MSQILTAPSARHRPSLWSLLLANRLATLGLIILLLTAIVALCAPLLRHLH